MVKRTIIWGIGLSNQLKELRNQGIQQSDS